MNKKEQKENVWSYPQNKIILASSSLTRRKILTSYGIKPIIKKHTIDEQKLFLHSVCLKPHEIVESLAKQKALSISSKYPDNMVIGSDQILIYNRKIFFKSKTKKDAFKLFMLLQKKEYNLISSIYVILKNNVIWKIRKEAKLLMTSLDPKVIRKYIKENEKEVLTILGGYKIEENKLNCIKILKGDIETIQGFPIKGFIKKLKKNEIISHW